MFQSIIAVGNLGKNPELVTTTGGTVICNFPMATSHRAKDKDETEWHNVVCFGKLAENVAKYKKKGDPVIVQGRINTQVYNKKDGTKGYATKLIAEQVRFIYNGTNGQVVTESLGEETSPDMDSIPF